MWWYFHLNLSWLKKILVYLISLRSSHWLAIRGLSIYATSMFLLYNNAWKSYLLSSFVEPILYEISPPHSRRISWWDCKCDPLNRSKGNEVLLEVWTMKRSLVSIACFSFVFCYYYFVVFILTQTIARATY